MRWRTILPVFALVAWCCAALAPLPASAVTPQQAKTFIDGLKQRGYHDFALEYLEQLKTNPHAPDELKATIGYEMAAVLIDGARLIQNAAQFESQLDRAQAELDAFLKNQPEHDLVSDALYQLGMVHHARAGRRITAAQRSGSDAKKLRDEALTFYQNAYAALAQRDKLLTAKLAPTQALPPESLRQQGIEEQVLSMRAARVANRLQIGVIEQEKAQALEPDKDKVKQQLLRAAKLFDDVWKNHNRYYAGARARYLQGRCLQEVGDHKVALECFADLMDYLDDQEALQRGLLTLIHTDALTSWLALKNFDEAITKAGEHVRKMRPEESRDPDWMALRLAMALAYEEAAKATEVDAVRRRYNETSLSLATVLSRLPGPQQRPARELVARLRGLPGAVAEVRNEPTTFAEAMERGDELRDLVATGPRFLKEMHERVAKGDDKPEDLEEVKKEIAELESSIPVYRAEAMRYYRLAMSLADENTNVDLLNRVRYYLSFLLYEDGQLYDAAVLGEWVGRNYPNSAVGPGAAKIALAAWSAAYTSGEGDKDFEVAKLTQVASFIAKQWNDADAAETANILMAEVAITQGRPEDALPFLDQVPDTSPRLGSSYIRVGQALAKKYFDTKRALPPGEPPTPRQQQQLAQLLTTATEVLHKGVERMEASGNITPSLVSAAFFLSQLYVDTSKSAKALEVLEHESYGPLKLVESGHATVQPPNFQQPGFSIATYNLSLRAYIGLISSDPAKIDRAEAMIQALEKLVPTDQLAGYYQRMAKELRDQFDEASPTERKSIADGFVAFLRKIRENKPNDFNSLAYVFNALLGLGDSFIQNDPDQARQYYGEAAQTGERIAELARNRTINVNPQNLLAIRVETAKAMGHVGRYDDALQWMAAILRERRTLLSVQVDAAMIYQRRGTEDPKYYALAIGGGLKDDKDQNIIWGWGRIAKVVQPQYDRFTEVFHQAQYNQAMCFYRRGRANTERAERERQIGFAKYVIEQTYRAYPDLGGDTWKATYDQLLKQVQSDLGQQPVGLAEFAQTGTSTQ